MKNNTVVTIGDSRYLWGIFLLIASMRRSGMDEPVLVGIRDRSGEAGEILRQFDDVRLFPLEDTGRSLTCLKPLVMLQAETEYVTWADSDGFFTGNCSDRMIPASDGEIHIRIRGAEENRAAFRGCAGEKGSDSIPAEIIRAWRADVGGLAEACIDRSCSACFLSVNRSARPFLRRWHEQMHAVLPPGDVGVVDWSLKHYRQLDESVLNSLLAFLPSAPKISRTYLMDRDRERMFVHFVGLPKPWQGWTRRSFRHFGAYTETAMYAVERGMRLPGGKFHPFFPVRHVEPVKKEDV